MITHLFVLSCAFFILVLSGQSIYYSKQNSSMAIELSFEPLLLCEYFLVAHSYFENIISDGSLLGITSDIFIQEGVFYGISKSYLMRFDF